jgi:hypothetical protein
MRLFQDKETGLNVKLYILEHTLTLILNNNQRETLCYLQVNCLENRTIYSVIALLYAKYAVQMDRTHLKTSVNSLDAIIAEGVTESERLRDLLIPATKGIASLPPGFSLSFSKAKKVGFVLKANVHTAKGAEKHTFHIKTQTAHNCLSKISDSMKLDENQENWVEEILLECLSSPPRFPVNISRRYVWREYVEKDSTKDS